MRKRELGESGIEVGAIGLGCMGMSEFYGPSDEEQSRAVLRRAYELGVTFFDTADMYGLGANERLLSGFLRDHPGVVVATKFGIVRREGNYERRIDNSSAYIAEACEASLKRLGVEAIDLYYAHRVDPHHPIEETIGAMARLVEAGKVRALGLCEVSAATLRRAHAVHPISALQTEYSLWTRDVERDILPACRKLGIAFVPYSPLGRGMLTGAIDEKTTLATGDFRRIAPRFQGDNLAANLRLVEAVKELAARKGCTAGQLALAWLLHQGDDIIPIPGTRRIRYLEENIAAAEIVLDQADLAWIEERLPLGAAAGARYPEAGMAGIDA